MAKNISGHSVPHLQGIRMHHNVQHVEPIVVPKVTTSIQDIYNNVTLCRNLMHINIIGLLNTLSLNILFDMGIMIKNQKLKIIEYRINQVNKQYLQCGFNITHIHCDSEFE